MASFSFETKGDFKNLENFLGVTTRGSIFNALEAYAQEGVSALAAATPEDTGATAAAWSAIVAKTANSYTISWTNDHKDIGGVPLVILLQIGHGTGTGGYVQGRNFINPAIQPVFDDIADKVWNEVQSA